MCLNDVIADAHERISDANRLNNPLARAISNDLASPLQVSKKYTRNDCLTDLADLFSDYLVFQFFTYYDYQDETRNLFASDNKRQLL